MGKFNIQRYTKGVVVADGQTVGTADTAPLNGMLRAIIANVPQLTGSTTITLNIVDADGAVIFNKATIAENAKTAFYAGNADFPLAVPVAGVLTATVTQTNAQSGAAATTNVILLIDRS